MAVSRRTAVTALAALPLCAAHTAPVLTTRTKEPHRMYGLIGKMRAQPGQRDALIAILLEGTAGMPGCLSYVIAKDASDADALWITEAWDSQDSHKASLALPSVRDAIGKGRPLIAGFGERFETEPVGGQGLAR
ncbi:putative quinol monooxygenase [Massilia sp.]|uniref:putative quinol monooxygenase n=1 Tax=Massilia sp. TaxID=1882437 RepID=UPI00289815B6|nr:putative quinol monooxygenase [Massilia sp.]